MKRGTWHHRLGVLLIRRMCLVEHLEPVKDETLSPSGDVIGFKCVIKVKCTTCGAAGVHPCDWAKRFDFWPCVICGEQTARGVAILANLDDYLETPESEAKWKPLLRPVK